MSSEGIVQAACVDALSRYCEGEGMKFNAYPPYANQQGNKPTQFCADLVGVLGNSSLILLEIKELSDGELKQFEDAQHQMLLSLQAQGLPVGYCYNNIGIDLLPSHEKEEGWARLTLRAMNRSIPTELPGRRPLQENHLTLYEWIASARASSGSDNFGRFGTLLRRSIRPDFMRNWFLALVYSPVTNSVFNLDQTQLKDMYDWMAGLAIQPNAQQVSAKVRRLQQAARIFPRPPSTLVVLNVDEDGTPSPWEQA
jgi:hypothetical protein